MIFEDGHFLAAKTCFSYFRRKFLESESAIIGIGSQNAVAHFLKEAQLLQESWVRPDVAKLKMTKIIKLNEA